MIMVGSNHKYADRAQRLRGGVARCPLFRGVLMYCIAAGVNNLTLD